MAQYGPTRPGHGPLRWIGCCDHYYRIYFEYWSTMVIDSYELIDEVYEHIISKCIEYCNSNLNMRVMRDDKGRLIWVIRLPEHSVDSPKRVAKCSINTTYIDDDFMLHRYDVPRLELASYQTSRVVLSLADPDSIQKAEQFLQTAIAHHASITA